MQGAAIRLENISQTFSTRDHKLVVAVQDVSIEIGEAEFVTIVGPSGCGKTTLLNIVAGLVKPTAGKAFIHDRPVDGTDRQIGYMYARDGLLPWRNARNNTALGLELRGVNKKERLERADELLDMVGLKGFENSFRSQLSQGMRQRVALARTLAFSPQILLLDEPFAALDAQTKTVLQTEFMRIWEESRLSAMMVTHDLDEAVLLADRVIVLSGRPGQVVADVKIEIERPRDLTKVRFTSQYQEQVHELWKLVRFI